MKKSLLFAFLLGTAMTATAQRNAKQVEPVHYCPRDSFNISKSNNLIVTHQN